MNTLQEWKKAKREELASFAIIKEGIEHLNFDPNHESLFTFLDTSFDELIALVEREVECSFAKALEERGESIYTVGQIFKEARTFSRLRGETNN